MASYGELYKLLAEGGHASWLDYVLEQASGLGVQGWLHRVPAWLRRLPAWLRRLLHGAATHTAPSPTRLTARPHHPAPRRQAIRGADNPLARAAAAGKPMAHLLEAAAHDLDVLQQLATTEKTLAGWVQATAFGGGVTDGWVAAASSLAPESTKPSSLPAALKTGRQAARGVALAAPLSEAQRAALRSELAGSWRWSEGLPCLLAYWVRCGPAGRRAAAACLRLVGCSVSTLPAPGWLQHGCAASALPSLHRPPLPTSARPCCPRADHPRRRPGQPALRARVARQAAGAGRAEGCALGAGAPLPLLLRLLGPHCGCCHTGEAPALAAGARCRRAPPCPIHAGANELEAAEAAGRVSPDHPGAAALLDGLRAFLDQGLEGPACPPHVAVCGPAVERHLLMTWALQRLPSRVPQGLAADAEGLRTLVLPSTHASALADLAWTLSQHPRCRFAVLAPGGVGGGGAAAADAAAILSGLDGYSWPPNALLIAGFPGAAPPDDLAPVFRHVVTTESREAP